MTVVYYTYIGESGDDCMYLDGKDKGYKICVCKNKTLGEVEDIIRRQHITDLKTLCEVADVGNKCGACREMLEELLINILTR